MYTKRRNQHTIGKALTEKPQCEVEWCTTTARGWDGMCFKHYQRMHLTGTLEPKQHYLSNIDREAKQADCEKCRARVRVTIRSNGSPRCSVARREQGMRDRYAISHQEFDAMVEAQGGVCAICGREPDKRHGERRLHLDHNHETGAIRDALCGKCNIALGLVSDDPRILREMIAYLERHGQAIVS